MTTAVIVQLVVAMTIMGFGSLGNSFIVLVFFLEYRRFRTLQSYELMVAILAFFSILYEMVAVLWLVVYWFSFCSYFGETFYKVTDTLIIFFTKSNYWFTAWLCFVYSMKIIKVKWKLFARLKQKISFAVRFMIIGTLLLCFSVSFPIVYGIRFRENSTEMCKNYYIATDEKVNSLAYFGMLSLMTSFLPLVLMLLSSLGIVIFLCRHSRNMSKNVTTSSSSSSDAHLAVAIMLICLIALYIACAGTALCVNLQVASGQFNVLIAIAYTNVIYTTVSSVILISGTVKLRTSFCRLCCPKRHK
ncbi:taste receptor type 2 member 40-like [Latimeria chalumnae]|uniref:taste receptor type 2 member 40-like n=1 Tax=Latimeria chalumnae TaxID=7897 RepID=UPI00313CF13B